ncbi:PaRep2b protein [Pyrobaculum oguniense TE7]|uniref:PaRep2b protein n=1 Tax=Pyrobaculum oguniense (strain DSM 13380 / JCM 10595 / TE7) TaxID=698757 RepID=H6Q9N5_PYROT|nr:PaRep2b protein [Pyrobaculum oguniense TE7]
MWRRTWLGRRERGAPLERSSISFWRRAGISSYPAVSASAGGAEERAKNVEVEHVLRGPPGAEPWLEARPRDERGDEIARIVIKWDGEGLRAVFNGDKEKAERLGSILNALGADVKFREHGGE